MGTKQFTTGYMTMRLSECPAVRLPYHRTWCWERWLLCISSHPSSLSWIELQLLLTLIGTVIVKEKTVEDTCGRYTSSWTSEFTWCFVRSLDRRKMNENTGDSVGSSFASAFRCTLPLLFVIVEPISMASVLVIYLLLA